MATTTTTSPTISTHHCICTTHILTTTHTLSTLPTRQLPSQDNASILPLLSSPNPSFSRTPTTSLHNISAAKIPIIIKREDGFEKRFLLRCQRCQLVVGYRLDEVHFEGNPRMAEEVVYILPGSLVETGIMKIGSMPEMPGWAQQDV